MIAWLLGEPDGESVRTTLAAADDVLTSDLTLVECDRTLIRAQASHHVRASEIARRRRLLETTAAHWVLLRVSPAVIDRARKPFPGDPIRSLDALHLASALAVADVSDNLAVLSLDRRVRASARALGLEVAPAHAPGA